MARPSSFTQKTADLICEKLADGVSLRTICSGESMPSMTSVFRWLDTFPEFREQYAHARDNQADALVEEMLTVAREPAKSKLGVANKRLLLDTLKWQASKLKPKKYGDQMRTELTGVDGGALQIGISLTPKESTE